MMTSVKVRSHMFLHTGILTLIITLITVIFCNNDQVNYYKVSNKRLIDTTAVSHGLTCTRKAIDEIALIRTVNETINDTL